MRARPISQIRLISRARSISQAPLAVDTGSLVRVTSGALSLGALSLGPKTAPTYANAFWGSLSIVESTHASREQITRELQQHQGIGSFLLRTEAPSSYWRL
jgi:hypothetical protein